MARQCVKLLTALQMHLACTVFFRLQCIFLYEKFRSLKVINKLKKIQKWIQIISSSKNSRFPVLADKSSRNAFSSQLVFCCCSWRFLCFVCWFLLLFLCSESIAWFLVDMKKNLSTGFSSYLTPSLFTSVQYLEQSALINTM